MATLPRVVCDKHSTPRSVEDRSIGCTAGGHGRAGLLFDYSTPGQKSVVRVVRPNSHLIAGAHPGDRVRIDESELKAPAVKAALWTEEEARSAAEAREARIRASLTEEPSAFHRATDAALQEAMRRREEEAERARTTL